VSQGRRISSARRGVQQTIYIRPEQGEKLQQLREATKVAGADFIREGIDLLLAREAAKGKAS
jgi:hypothetical protein